jgi:hypothetical protein
VPQRSAGSRLAASFVEYIGGLQLGGLPDAIALSSDGELRAPGSQDAALGCVVSGIRPSSRTPPSVSSTARVGGPLFCGAGKLVDVGARTANDPDCSCSRARSGCAAMSRSHAGAATRRSRPTPAKELSCRETVTYSALLLVTATATSEAVGVGG